MPKRGGAKVSGCGSQLTAPQFGGRKISHVGIGVIFGIVVLAAASPASAYRPFDGTDAAVADLGEVEIEFQPIGAIRPGQTKPISDAILNFGFAERWEFSSASHAPGTARRRWSDQRLERGILEVRHSARRPSR
jgi:hypothetical protein